MIGGTTRGVSTGALIVASGMNGNERRLVDRKNCEKKFFMGHLRHMKASVDWITGRIAERVAEAHSVHSAMAACAALGLRDRTKADSGEDDAALKQPQ